MGKNWYLGGPPPPGLQNVQLIWGSHKWKGLGATELNNCWLALFWLPCLQLLAINRPKMNCMSESVYFLYFSPAVGRIGCRAVWPCDLRKYFLLKASSPTDLKNNGPLLVLSQWMYIRMSTKVSECKQIPNKQKQLRLYAAAWHLDFYQKPPIGFSSRQDLEI